MLFLLKGAGLFGQHLEKRQPSPQKKYYPVAGDWVLLIQEEKHMKHKKKYMTTWDSVQKLNQHITGPYYAQFSNNCWDNTSIHD